MAENNNNNRRRKPKTNSYKPKGDKEILAKNILELNLCEKTYEILTNGRVTIIADLLQYREKELY